MDKISWKSQYYDILFHEVRDAQLRQRIKNHNLYFHSRNYVSETPARFINMLAPQEIETEKELILRDGIRDLSYFFQKKTPGSLRPYLYIAKELRPLVPKEWARKVGFYEYYAKKVPDDIRGIFIYGTENDEKEKPDQPGPHLIFDLNLKIDYADSYLTHLLLSQGHWFPYKHELQKKKIAEVSPYHGFILGK